MKTLNLISSILPKTAPDPRERVPISINRLIRIIYKKDDFRKNNNTSCFDVVGYVPFINLKIIVQSAELIKYKKNTSSILHKEAHTNHLKKDDFVIILLVLLI
jgi:hypothetical protein